ncbi:MAG: PKD domain-containing protein [Candidatus Thermoplasmatota archaeon]|nr:PKD domain-containing protein [Candidatus Thermoplasmatota archaeon]
MFAAALAVLLSLSGIASAAAIHTDMSFSVKEIPNSAEGGFEPHVLAAPGVDGKEWIYVDSPTGLGAVATPGNLWASKDGGATWEYLSANRPPTTAGSGDSYTAVSSEGYIYETDLWLATATVETSKDGGVTWIQNPAASVYVADDRQWLVMGPTIGGLPVSPAQTVYFAFNQIPAGLVMVKSYVTDDALVWIPCNNGQPITQSVGSRDYFAIDQKDGTIYMPNAGDNSVYVSSDGGSSFTSYPLEGMKQNIFVSVDVDSAGNVYVAWTDQADMYVAVSNDKAKTWKTHMITDTLGTRVLPWVTAGDAGMIGLTWYETLDEGESDYLDTSVWNLTAAVCVDALSDNPTFYITTVQNEVHKGTISTGGLGGAADRDLGDFFTCDVDKDGKLIMVYGNDWKDKGASNSRQSFVMFGKQMEGPFLKESGIETNFTYSPASPVIGDQVKFTDTSSAANATISGWLWEFGDGKNSTEQNPTHTYSTAGKYDVTLAVTDNNGRSDLTTKQITVKSTSGNTNGATPGFETLALLAGILIACIAGRAKR